MMKPCNILDLGKLDDILTVYHGHSMIMRIREDMVTGRGTYFMEDGMVILYEDIGLPKYQAHVYGKRGGRKQVAFVKEAGRWMKDNAGATCIVNFADKDRLDIQLFMRMVGAQRIGEIPGTSQIMFVTTEEVL